MNGNEKLKMVFGALFDGFDATCNRKTYIIRDKCVFHFAFNEYGDIIDDTVLVSSYPKLIDDILLMENHEIDKLWAKLALNFETDLSEMRTQVLGKETG